MSLTVGLILLSGVNKGEAAEDIMPAGCETARKAALERWPYKLPAHWESARWHYVRGACLEASGRLKEAGGSFSQGREAAPEFEVYWDLRLFGIALGGGRTSEAVRILQRIYKNNPGGEVASELREMLRKWLADLDMGKDGGIAAEVVIAYLNAVPPSIEDALMLQPLLSYPAIQQNQLLTTGLERLMWAAPPDRATAEKWARVAGRLEKGESKPTGKEYILRAKSLHVLRMYDQQISELGRKGVVWPKDAQKRIGSYYFRALIRKREYTLASKEINRPEVIRRFGFGDAERLGTELQIAQRARRAGRVSQLIKEWEKLDPKANGLGRAYMGVVRHYAERSNQPQVLKWSRRFIQRFPDHPDVWVAYWLPLWSHYQKKQFKKALEWGDLAISSGQTFHPDVMAQFFYWRGKLLREQGQDTAAGQSMQALQKLWPTSFYGLYARYVEGRNDFSVNQRGWPDVSHPEIGPPDIKKLWREPTVAPSIFLLVVGEEDLGAGELGRLMGTPLPDGVLEEMGQAFAYFRQFRLQFRWASNYYYTVLKREPVTETHLWHNAFPLAFWDLVESHTRSFQVNPFFVLAVMREESHYYAEAGSRAGARGLMQLMPATAKQTAQRNKIAYKETNLLLPDLNIALGTLYIKHVLKRFDGHPFFAAAAYNAGPGAVRRWRKEHKGKALDEFIEAIPYDETRAYVKRVISSYLIYKKLYTDSGGSKQGG